MKIERKFSCLLLSDTHFPFEGLREEKDRLKKDAGTEIMT